MALRDASTLVRSAVEEAIRALDTRPEDAGAVRLARFYADVIDQAGDAEDPGKARAWCARWIAPLLLDCLESLGATPAARSRIKKGEPARDATQGKLTALRAARR